ncbi:MAG: thiolase family protein [Acidobacteria bacterium]|nr:thiolase family protein [Acidobacteriota bacterium]MBV9478206.1 thiolase family protein [Acidobacteriota bacterium]
MPQLKESIYLIAALRTPIGKFGGGLASLTAAQLGTASANATLARSGIDPHAIDEVIFGNARQAGVGPNVARQIAIKSGLRHEVPAYTVNQACGSGLRAIMNAADQIRLGQASVVLAGGTESMSNTPYLLPRARWGYRMGNDEIVDGMVRDGFLCPLADEMMGSTAETLAEQYGISRDEQDRYAVASQQKAARAYDEHRFADEIAPVTVAGKKGDVVIDTDEHPRFDATLDSMAKLPPVFRKGGSVHAGNSSGITDGASSMLVASEEAVAQHKLTPMARIIGYAQAGVDPKIMGIGPVPATRKLLDDTRLSLDDVDLIELNEAFAAQVIACDRELHFDPAKLNVHGGAIALGHPIGCTGARITTTLLHALQTRERKRGLATLCISGGMGLSLLVERV